MGSQLTPNNLFEIREGLNMNELASTEEMLEQNSEIELLDAWLRYNGIIGYTERIFSVFAQIKESKHLVALAKGNPPSTWGCSHLDVSDGRCFDCGDSIKD